MPDEKLTAYRGGKALRRGWTTGSCAAAASQAAAVLLLTGIAPPEIHLHTPGGITFCLPVEDAHMSGNAAVCTVRKDAGDDPDITNGVRITASVRRIEKGVTCLLYTSLTISFRVCISTITRLWRSPAGSSPRQEASWRLRMSISST